MKEKSNPKGHLHSERGSVMNLLILLMIILETVLGVSATLYVVIGLPVYFVWKFLYRAKTGEAIL